MSQAKQDLSKNVLQAERSRKEDQPKTNILGWGTWNIKENDFFLGHPLEITHIL